MNWWLVFGLMLSTTLLAQQVPNTPGPAPLETPATSAPAVPPGSESTTAAASKAEKKKTAKKKASKKSAAAKPAPKPALKPDEPKTVPLQPGLATVVASNVNVRGQAKLNSEVVGRVTKGDTVTVLDEITLKHSGPDEPSAWAKILLPTNSHVWVNSMFVDTSSKTVVPKRLNLRGGPGENYSVLGILEKGEAIKEIGSKGDWLEIEAPPSAFAFVAAQYLVQQPPEAPATPPAVAPAVVTPVEPAPVTPPAVAATPPAVPATPPPTPVTPAPVEETPVAAPAPTEPPITPAATPVVTPTPAPAVAAPAPTPAAVTPPTPAATPAAPEFPAVEEPLPKRVVQREGLVRGTTSIQAPSKFELISPDNGRVINYLYTTSRDLDLRRYKGMRIIVTGEEGLDERWRNTPVITIQKIQVLQ